MNPAVLTTVGAPDPNATPTTLTEVFALLNTVIQSSIQGSYTPYVIGSTTPSVDDQDKAWIKLDTSGRPLEIRTYYNGNWRRIYSGIPGEVRYYIGDPTQDFDSTGLGTIGGNWDGWALMNGNNGTANFSDRFIASAEMTGNGFPGYASGWTSNVENTGNKAAGGNPSITLTLDQVPSSPTPSTSVFADRYTASGNGPSPTGDLLGITAGGTEYSLKTSIIGGGNTTPTPVNATPQYVVMALAQFVGYA